MQNGLTIIMNLLTVGANLAGLRQVERILTACDLALTLDLPYASGYVDSGEAAYNVLQAWGMQEVVGEDNMDRRSEALVWRSCEAYGAEYPHVPLNSHDYFTFGV